MKIDLAEIGASGITIERVVPADGFPSIEDGMTAPLRLVADARLQLSVDRAGERFHLRGTMSAEVQIECSRCLEAFSFAVRPEFDYYLVPRRPVELWAEVEIDDAAKREVEVDSLELDLLHLVEEQVRLGLPMKPLCAESCRGICHGCGVQLSHEACRCSGDEDLEEETGLAALSSLLDRLKNDPSAN